MTFAELTERVRRITGSVGLPVSVDVESGYGLDPAALVEGLLAVGAVGLNIEDVVHGEDGRIRTADEHADLVGRLRAAADATGVHMVINARTDAFTVGLGEDDQRVDLAIARMRLCADAGADCLYPIALHDEATLARITAALPLPVNAIASVDTDDLGMYRRAGAGRITFGPLWQMALGRVSGEWLSRWRDRPAGPTPHS
jgi:2-methylisocitrate lyase-like PEP mutase family enzyme